MSKVNIVIIGAGEIAARRHIPALLQGEHTNFYGVLNLHPESTKAVAQKYGVKAYESFDEVLFDENVDAVLISTPPDRHAEPAIAALVTNASSLYFVTGIPQASAAILLSLIAAMARPGLELTKFCM